MIPKTREELERAHLLLIAALEVGVFGVEEESRARDSLAIICWALGHEDESNVFSRMLASLDKHIVIHGVQAVAGPGMVH